VVSGACAHDTAAHNDSIGGLRKINHPSNPNRALKNAHLLRFPHPSSLRRTSKYASLLRISGALHLGIFEHPEKNRFLAIC
jgi:hypothetical protein